MAAPITERQQQGRLLWLLMALLLVSVLRLWRLPEAGPSDYDSVHNWSIILEVAQGNFLHLFHLGSPGFYLAYAPLGLFTSNFLVFQTTNALLSIIGLGLFVAWVSQKAEFTGPETAALTLLGGTSLLLTFSGRDFTMSSLNLILCAGLMRSHYARMQQPSAVRILRVAVWLAVGLTCSYKFLFVVPIVVALELWQADPLWRQRNLWVKVLLILAAPYVVFGVVAVAIGLPWYRWLAFYVLQVTLPKPNLSGRENTFNLDLLYYFRYLANYEAPVLLIGLVVSAWLVWRGWRRGAMMWGKALPLLPYLFVWACCLLAGMSLLVKAPRGILFAYLPLAALVLLSARQLLPRLVIIFLVLAVVGLNVFRVQQELYAALPTPYPLVAAWLQAHGATKVASTVSQGVAPYLSSSQTLKVVNNERQLASLRQQGYEYVLLDGYWRVAGVHQFDSLRRTTPVAAWPAPHLQQALLFLEHSEYTGNGFTETLAAQQEAAADSLPLRLYRLQ
ncbi:hypothetical protein [Hymenobacter arizonensis]|uniref:hypothetical protein n=1 Tax=Hymenobacter arizonensis TaxID=1227077 RepID=UPI0011609B5F|nr:hypothetical protein [Hymenobacter arizonensis]